ncbi:MAG: metallophosphoesterase [Caldiserica bacterium]|jgi:predicted MPP superfamily phosphohydrolase|nr:metallophosphoesterase [Caldisericota bacterium]MDH7562026.1 metallophosphoesterase [Caldisericota bacterium]
MLPQLLAQSLPIFFLLLGGFLFFFYFKKGPLLLVFSLILLFLGSIMFFSVFISPFLLKVYRVSYDLSSIIQKQSYRIAFFSDFHCGALKGKSWVKRVVETVNQEKPDLVLIGGDFVLKAEASALKDLFSPLKDLKARDGVFAVLGNHDFGIPGEDLSLPLKEVLEELNITLLQNECVELENFNLVGLDEVWAGKSDLERAFLKVNPEKPVIGLCHNPDLFLYPASTKDRSSFRADLWLLGHTHNGQLRLPIIGPVVQSTGTGMEWGFYNTPLGKAFVSQGVGESGARVRLFTRPEVVIIDLIADL